MTPLSDSQSAFSSQRPTMRHVAALAGVGIKTVSRVINGEPNVSEARPRRKVLAAAQSLNYQPDPTRAISAAAIAGPRHSACWSEASATRSPALCTAPSKMRHPHAASPCSHPASTTTPSASWRSSPRFSDAASTGSSSPPRARARAYLLPEQERGTPFVFVDREPVGIDADAVVSDNALGASAATRHLIEHGHRRIAFLGDRSQIQTARERRRGFLEELGRAGISTNDVTIIEGLHNEEKARAAMTALLDSPNPPTAVFSGQNLITIGAIRALRDREMHRSVALVGFDDFELADLLEPGITVVAQDPRRIGALAAERLFARLEGDRQAEQTYTVPTRLIPRGSGEIPAGAR